jgi:hypothetical protein
MGKQLNRKVLKVNNRRSVKQEFTFNNNLGYKSKADPSIVTWASPGKGMNGESVNSSGDVGSRQIANRNWRPI